MAGLTPAYDVGHQSLGWSPSLVSTLQRVTEALLYEAGLIRAPVCHCPPAARTGQCTLGQGINRSVPGRWTPGEHLRAVESAVARQAGLRRWVRGLLLRTVLRRVSTQLSSLEECLLCL